MGEKTYTLKNHKKIRIGRFEPFGRDNDYIIDFDSYYSRKPVVVTSSKENESMESLEGVLQTTLIVNRCHIYKHTVEQKNLLSEKDAIKHIKKYFLNSFYPGRRQ